MTDPQVGPGIRILIADDHPVVRQGLSALVQTEPGMQVIGEAADGIEAVQGARHLRPDIILLDLVMPGKDGLEVIREIRRDNPEARILVLTSFAEEETVLPAIKAGALGYLLKESSPQALLQAIRDIYHGKAALDPGITRHVFEALNQQAEAPPTPNPLTERETEILALVARGFSTKEMAKTLAIQERTVRTHIGNILAKLHVTSRMKAALYALREGFISSNADK